MQVFQRIAKPFRVALRKESVDRNLVRFVAIATASASLSARRAWIEITVTSQFALSQVSRSPQGERG